VQVSIARIGKPHGIRGEVTVQVLTDAPEDRFIPGAVLDVEGIKGVSQLTIESARWNKQILLLAFEEIADRNEAETLRGGRLMINPVEAGAAENPDEFFEHELKGLRIIDKGADIGEITGLRTGAAQDLLVADIEGREVLIPFVAQIVREVDVDGGRAVVDLPAGLTDLGVD
jgi:16S rRNA processing protein RimM